MDKLTLLENLETVARKLRALGLHPFTRLGRAILSALVRNITIKIDGGLSLSGSIYHRGYLMSLRKGVREAYMTELFKQALRPGQVVCDIRSYIGYYALLAAQHVGSSGKVFAFEPDPHNFAYLSLNVKTNHFENIVVTLQKAVSDKSGCFDFYIYEGDRSQSSLFEVQERTVRKIQVETIALDDFLAEPMAVDVVKIDIEGGEIRALRGMKRLLNRSPRLTMFVECNPKALQRAGSSAKELLQILEDNGFRVLVIDEAAKSLQMPDIGTIEKMKYVNLFCQRLDAYAG